MDKVTLEVTTKQACMIHILSDLQARDEARLARQLRSLPPMSLMFAESAANWREIRNIVERAADIDTSLNEAERS